MADQARRRARRVLYVQYTNPAAYPPIEHSARLLADEGWEVLLLGTGILSDVLTIARHGRIRSALMPYVAGGWRQKAHYLRFAAWASGHAREFGPGWIYASDPLACPASLVLARTQQVPLIYHEHDSPLDTSGSSIFMRTALAARRRAAALAAVCVLPSEPRSARFAREHSHATVATVWNCPLRSEALAQARPPATPGLRVLYHGSIVPARLPLAVIDALAQLPDEVTLTVAGYETAGHPGYVDALRRRAHERGVARRIHFVGTIASREALLRQCATCDAGLALMPLASADFNEQTMMGASNKPFDYMACGLALVVSTLPEWEQAFVHRGFADACDPESADSVAAVLRRLAADPDRRAAMGERGRQMIRHEWNYDRAFMPVRARMEAGACDARASAARAEPVHDLPQSPR